MDQARRDEIDGHIDAQTCSVCGGHLDYSEGYYTVSHAHWICVYPDGYASADQQLAAMKAKVENAVAALGIKPKRHQASIGQGGPTNKLKIIVADSAKEHFGTDDVTEVNIYLPPPVWRQHRFDVMRVEGSMSVNGRKVCFGSWVSVSELIKYRKVKFDNDWPNLGMFPDLESKRTRNKKHD